MAEMLQRSQQSNKVRVDHLILAGGGAQYFEDAMREVFAGMDFSVLPKPVAPRQNRRGAWRPTHPKIGRPNARTPCKLLILQETQKRAVRV